MFAHLVGSFCICHSDAQALGIDLQSRQFVSSDVPPTTSTTVAMKLNEGDRLDLVCNVSTQPVPLLYWQFNPTPVS